MISNWSVNNLRVLAIMIAAAAIAAGKPAARRESLSLTSLRIAAGERVVGFELHIRSARIVSMPEVPTGWDVHIQNNPSWNTVIRASSLVGAAAVDAGFFKTFLLVEKNESLGLPFGVSGDVIVTRDFVKERRIRISMHNILLEPAPLR
jgi:hypothetical protein